MILQRNRKRWVPGLNTTSTADISFMLLIFFLVTTNMDVDKGLPRLLPPINKEEGQPSLVDKETTMTLTITPDSRLLLDGKPFPVARLRQRAMAFVSRVGKRHLIKVEVDPASQYDVYFQMQNALVEAYRQLRDAEARRRYGVPMAQLPQQKRDEIGTLFPQRIAEQYHGATAGDTANGAAAADSHSPQASSLNHKSLRR